MKQSQNTISLASLHRDKQRKLDELLTPATLVKRLAEIGLLHGNGVGKLAVLASFGKDVGALVQLKVVDSSWSDAIKRTLIFYVPEDDVHAVKKDVAIASSLPSCTLKYLVCNPNPSLNAEIKLSLRAARAAILIYHLINDFFIAEPLSRSMAALFNAEVLQAKELATSFSSIDVTYLEELQSKCKAGDQWYKLLSSIIQALRAPLDEFKHRNESTKFTGRRGKDDDISNEFIDGNLASVISVKKDRRPHSIPHSGNLIAYQMSLLPHATPKDFSGVDGVFSRLRQEELLEFMPKVINDFKIANDDVPLSILVAFHFRCPIHCFNMVHLRSDIGVGAWLDLDLGHFCWNRKMATGDDIIELIPLPEDVIRIPMPIEISEELKLRELIFPQAQSLGGLFRMPIGEMKRKARRYVFDNALTSHRPFLTKLSESLGRFVLTCCGDEAYSAAIGCDFTLATKANFNYMVLMPTRINQICSEVYGRLGYSGLFKSPVQALAGSAQGMQVEVVRLLLAAQLDIANESFNRLTTRTTYQELVAIHNSIASAILVLTTVLLGLRLASEYCCASHTFDLKNNLMLATDKASSAYLESRLVPIPELLNKWLIFYKDFLTRLAARLEGKNKKLSECIASIASDDCKPGSIPLFFHISKGAIKPLGSGDVIHVFSEQGLQGNVGRHFLDCILRDKVGSALINAMMGRANPGQEAFGSRSALSPIDAMDMLRNAIDAEIDLLGLEMPPDIGGVRFAKKILIKTCSPGLWGKVRTLEQKGAPSELCPFHEFSLINHRGFQKIIAAWMSEKPGCSVGDVIVSLVIADGVLHLEELLDGVNQLAKGRIYRSADRFWVDTNTETLGVRRVELSPATIQIVAKTFSTGATVFNRENLVQDASRVVRALFITAEYEGKNPTLESLISLAADFYAVSVPGPLRDWMSGALHARTSRIETIARHLLRGVEPLTSKNLLRRRPSIIQFDRQIMETIYAAAEKDKNYGSAQLRMKKLDGDLALLEKTLSELDQIVMNKFARFLIRDCPKIKTPSSLIRHYKVVRGVVRSACDDFSEIDQLMSVDWQFEIVDWMEQRKVSKSDQAALNYLLKMFRQHTRLVSANNPASATRIFSDIPSRHEVNQALMLLSQSHSSNFSRLTEMMLALMSEHPLRAEDVASLRTIDLHGGSHPHIVITKQATGTKKSSNANRVLALNQVTGQALYQLAQLRSKAFPEHEIVSIFGTSPDPQSFDGADELLAAISRALVAVTGSPRATPHSLRKMVVTCTAHAVLSPIAASSNSALSLRQSLYALAVRAGHGDFKVTFAHYVHDVDFLRRQWVDRLIWKDFSPSWRLVSGLTGLNPETVRKKIGRGCSVHLLHDSCEPWSPYFLNRIFDLQNFIAKDVNYYGLDDVVNHGDPLLASARFLAAKLIGLGERSAAQIIDLNDELFFQLNSAVSVFESATGLSWHARNAFNFSEVDRTLCLKDLVQQCGEWILSQTEIFQIARCFPENITKSWCCSKEQLELFERGKFFSNIQAAGFESIVSVMDDSVASNFKTEGEIKKLGVSHVQFLRKRHFPGGATHRLSFVFKGDSKAAWPRRMHLATFFITTFLIAHICYNFDRKENQ